VTQSGFGHVVMVLSELPGLIIIEHLCPCEGYDGHFMEIGAEYFIGQALMVVEHFLFSFQALHCINMCKVITVEEGQI
jgi:hypothetical protein